MKRISKIAILVFIAGFTFSVSSCKKTETPPEHIQYIKPSAQTIQSAAGAVVPFEFKLLVETKIDKLVGTYKVNSGPNVAFVDKGFSNSSNTDTYIDSFTVPSGVVSGDVITFTFVLTDKNGSNWTKSLVINIQ